MPDEDSLWERLGGIDPFRNAVDDFCRAVLGDPDLAGYFDGMDGGAIKHHQVALFTQLLGGPGIDAGQALAAAHHPLRIPVEHYQAVVGHLLATLGGMGIPDGVFAAIGRAAGAVQPEIVSDPASDPPIGDRLPGEAAG